MPTQPRRSIDPPAIDAPPYGSDWRSLPGNSASAYRDPPSRIYPRELLTEPLSQGFLGPNHFSIRSPLANVMSMFDREKCNSLLSNAIDAIVMTTTLKNPIALVIPFHEMDRLKTMSGESPGRSLCVSFMSK